MPTSVWYRMWYLDVFTDAIGAVGVAVISVGAAGQIPSGTRVLDRRVSSAGDAPLLVAAVGRAAAGASAALGTRMEPCGRFDRAAVAAQGVLARGCRVLCQRLTWHLVAPDDDENVGVNEDHDEQRREEKTGVLTAKAQLLHEFYRAIFSLLVKKKKKKKKKKSN